MRAKLIDTGVLIALLLLGLLYGYRAMSYPDSGSRGVPGPGYFPLILAIGLILATVIGIARTILKTDDVNVSLPNIRYVLATIAFISLLYLGWAFLGRIYGVLVLFFLASFIVYKGRPSVRSVMAHTALSFVGTVIVYLVFEEMLNIRL